MGHISEVLDGLKPIILMIFVQITYTGMNIFLKLAAYDGMSMRVLIAYRWVFSSAFTVPLAFIFERKNRPQFTWKVLLLSFLCGLFGGFLGQNLYVESLILTSATFASAIANLTPAVTLILAVSLRFEKLGMKTQEGKAKALGILMGIGGAMLITFYKGVELKIWSTNLHILEHKIPQKGHVSSNYILGSAFAICSCSTYALWLIIQKKIRAKELLRLTTAIFPYFLWICFCARGTKISKIYPRHYTIAALTSTMASIQSLILSLCLERNWSNWKLGWNIRLLTVFYSGIVASGIVLILIAWCVKMRGPVFVASFSPLSLVLVAILASLILEETLHLGSILGAAMIVCGLYMVLWGQSKELKANAKLVPTETSPTNELIEIVSDSTLNASPHGSSSTKQQKNAQNN